VFLQKVFLRDTHIKSFAKELMPVFFMNFAYSPRNIPPVFILLLSLALFSCQALERRPPFMADVSHIEIQPIEILRYEEVLFNLNPDAMYEELQPYLSKFGVFLGEAIHTPEGQQQLYEYITDPLVRQLYADTREVWPSLENLEEDLTEAFRFYRYHFPDEPIPQFFSYISVLDHNYPIKYYDGVMVIGLDLYLGPNYEKYSQAGIQLFKQHRMQPAFVPVDVMRMMAEKHMQQSGFVPQHLLDFMIYEGTVLYFLDSTLPLTPDSLKMGYTADQQRWMEANLERVWTFFLENELLFSRDRRVIKQFVGDAPFTSPLGGNTPPRTAAFIGWRIVREFMRNNPTITLEQLINKQDSQQILQQSRFRP